MKKLTIIASLLSSFLLPKAFSQQEVAKKAKPTIVLVHGLWADGSCWTKVISILQNKGYNVISVQNPTTTIEEDVAATKRALELVNGDVVLVGHSWGGFVISEAGDDPKVKSLVYVAAYMPDKNETVPSLSEMRSPTILQKYLVSTQGFVTLSKEGIEKSFANDLPAGEKNIAFATQQPASTKVFTAVGQNVSWKLKPSWYIVASNDNTINPDLERFMAKRAMSKITELQSCHVAMLAQPEKVVEVILNAAK